MAHLYKSRLQNIAQKSNIAFPTYTCETQGPPHSRLFKARVTIDGVTYEGPEFCTTLKDAEHAAAKVAFTSLSPNGTQEDDCLYKSLLQELAQKRGLLLPVYATNSTGMPHMPCFRSTVEISGECYVGQEARTKKQAEMNAAKVAYTVLTEGGPRTNNVAAFSDVQKPGPSSFGSLSLQTVTTHKKEPTLIPTTSKTPVRTTINDQPTFSIAKETEKAKGFNWLSPIPSEDIQKLKAASPPVVIHQSQPTATSNLVTRAAQARGGSGSNEIKKQSLVTDRTSNQVTDSGAARTHPTKIVIRPHVQGMTYDGPIQNSDNEWVAMKVSVDYET